MGWIEPDARRFSPFAETAAWNFQLGSMLQWLGADRVIYNTSDRGAVVARVHDLSQNRTFDLPAAFFAVAPDAAEVAGFDMGRGHSVNPGYSYAGVGYPLSERPAPESEGLMLMNPVTGQTRMAISYAELAERFFTPHRQREAVLLGRLLYSPGGKRLAFSARYWESGTNRRRTCLLVLELASQTIHRVVPADWLPQHFAWRDDQSLLVWSQPFESPACFHLYRIGNQAPPEPVGRNLLLQDGHVAWFNGGASLITDTFPQPDGSQHLYRLDIEPETLQHLGAFPAPNRPMDLRCDLHPCLSRDEKWLAVDSFHEKFRGIYLRSIAKAHTA